MTASWDHAAHVARCNAENIAAGMCLGRGMSHQTTPAAYVWDCGPGRNQLPLCRACCTQWRADAADPDSGLDAPFRLTEL